MTDNELLLNPTGDFTVCPVCDLCGAEMPLAKFEALPDKPEYSTFRCAKCSHTETFLAEAEEQTTTRISKR